ncbi:MAG: hypothetical protein KDA80_18825 [Planctomycetaceae bacterium]|nr:hypothetical protein [Planctomycetaceae bacterium]
MAVSACYRASGLSSQDRLLFYLASDMAPSSPIARLSPIQRRTDAALGERRFPWSQAVV